MARPATAAVRLLTGEREPVRLATLTNIILHGLQTIDGVLTQVGDRVLVKDQSDQTENGIYTASEGQWFRAADARTARTMQKGTTVTVQEGTVNAGKTFRFDTDEPQIGDDPVKVVDAVLTIASQIIGTFGAIWASALTVATYAEAWLILKLNGSLSTRALIKALTPQPGMSVLLTEAGRGGNFVWTVGDFSAFIMADTAEGIYLKADSVAANVGAWVRTFEGSWFAHWFGIVPFAPAAANVTAFNAMLTLHNITQGPMAIRFRSGNHVNGAIPLDAKIVYSTAHPLVLLADEIDGTVLRWSNSDGGLKITYTDALKPPSVIGLRFETSVAGGGTALNIIAPDSASITECGPVLQDVDCRGLDPSSQYWTKGMHLQNVWYPQIVRPDMKGKDNTFDMTHAIHLEDCQAPQIREVALFHCQYGVQASGSIHGEGVNISGGEMVGVGYGIDWSPSVFKPGITIHDMHINASKRCIRLSNTGQTTLHDLSLYKTNVNEADWEAIEMLNCHGNRVHDIMMATPAVVGHSNDGIVLSDCTYNEIHDIYAESWTGPGAIVLLSGSSNYNKIHHLTVGRLASGLVPVATIGLTGLNNRFSETGDPTRRTLTANSTTPSVENAINSVYKTANGVATAITNFTNGYDGQIIEVLVNDVNTSFTHNANLIMGGSVGSGGLMTNGTVLRFRLEGTTWREISRNVPIRLQGTATWDPASIAAGASAVTTVAVTGAVLGDTAVASFSLDQAGLSISAYVSSTNTVFVRLKNETAGAIDLASGTLKATVFK